VLDRQTNGLQFTIPELLDMSRVGDYDPAPLPAGTPPIYPNTVGPNVFQNLDNTGRFKILVDRKYARGQVASWAPPGTIGQPASPTGVVYDPILDSANIDLKGLDIEYGSTTGALAEQRTNSISMFVMVYKNSTKAPNPAVAMNSDVQFKVDHIARLTFMDP